jgi:uncharacterized membrane protein YidH (DUF202 family)
LQGTPIVTLQDRIQRPRWALSVYGLVRTALSSERALMAWMSTAVALYSFGLTITNFADYLAARGGAASSPVGPARLGLFLILLGMVGLALGIIEHRRRLRRMHQLGLPRVSLWSLPVAGALALLVIGAVTLIEVGPGVL